MADFPDRRQVPVRRFPRESPGESLVAGPGLDWVIVEEPLEIVLDDEPLMVTMRTPGSDIELALGFCYSEGIVASLQDVSMVEPIQGEAGSASSGARIAIHLTEQGRERLGDSKRVARLFPASSACGVCGRPSLEDLWQRIPKIRPVGLEPAELVALVSTLLAPLRAQQSTFAVTGGCHAAALFDLSGRCLVSYEDVGRHNAVDKVVGHLLSQGELPSADRVLLSSGRAGFEIVQKAATAGVPVVAALGAASSLAIELAEFAGVTLLSFVAGKSINLHDRNSRG